MRVKEFFDSEFKDFSRADMVRSLPSIVDGLKDSQRKAVFGTMKHGMSEIKVAQLGGHCALVSAYEHGETSMCDTIVGLAQDYPGSNNINLFEPIGQFGSILSDESSAHRYIYTKPSKHLKQIIKPDDEDILQYKDSDGKQVEPVYYFPIIPLWLVNGVIGIATGHACKILPRDPSKVKKLILKILKGQSVTQQTIDSHLLPYYKGWKGEIKINDGQIQVCGVIEKVNTTTLKIKELPVGYGIDKIKSILVNLMDSKVIKDYDNNSTDESIDITVNVPRELTSSNKDLKSVFSLVSRHRENVTMWTKDWAVKKYTDVYDALLEFIEFRLEKYEERRLKKIELLQNEISYLNNKMIFIVSWNNIDNPGRLKADQIKDIMLVAGVDEQYLDQFMSMRISSLSLDMINSLKAEQKTAETELAYFEGTSNKELYIKELESVVC